MYDLSLIYTLTYKVVCTHIKIRATLEEPRARIFVASPGNNSDIHRPTKNADVRLTDKAVYYIQYPVRMQIFFYGFQKVRIPYEAMMRITTYTVIYVFLTLTVNKYLSLLQIIFM